MVTEVSMGGHSETGKAPAGNHDVGRTVKVQKTGQARYGTDAGAGCDLSAHHTPSGALGQIEQGHQMCLSRQHIDAEACFRAAIALAPEWPMPHNNLGWVLQAQGRNEEALVCYNRALQIDATQELAQANLAYLLANLYFFIGKFAEARSMWLFLANIYPEDHQVLDNLISTALRVNDFSDAGQWATCYAAVTKASVYHPMLAHATAVPPDVALPTPKLSRGKLQHDLEQYQYLRDKGLLDQEFDDIINYYSMAINRLDENNTALQESIYNAPEIKNTYGRIIHHYPANKFPGNAVAVSESSMHAEQKYLKSKLGIVIIDDFLSDEALSELQKFCLESTVWHSNSYSHDRLGAFFREGFNCPLLLQIAEEMQFVFPNVIGKKHPLLQMWAYKYRHNQPSTHPHADFAAVNVNFWITPDGANQNSESGGLIIYDIEAPMDWDFDAYNRQGDKISTFLKSSDAKCIVIPYRCNRAIIFNSDLFHATAPLEFRPGYINKRVNITMLYGEREAAKKE